MPKLKFRTLLIFLLIVTLISSSALAYGVEGNSQLKPYSDVMSKDLSSYDFSKDADLIYTLSYNLTTKWPSTEKTPAGFSPSELMEWGKNPGLGINELHSVGYTGNGVNIAYIDQGLGDALHPAYQNVDLHYYTDVLEQYSETLHPSMHGPAVLSLLAGEEIGVAPDASVYFVANPAWLTDQRTHADSIRKIIEVNKTLSKDKKIKVIGFSDNIDPQEKYPEEFEKAVKEAENEGIYVLFCGEFAPAVVKPSSDRNDPSNYYPLNYPTGDKVPYEEGKLYVPVDRTVASMDNDYIKYGLGGLSWTTPYITGLMSIGWQINPDLTAKELLDFMYKSATKYNNINNGGLINPKEFVKAIESTSEKNDIKKDTYYTIFAYNSDKLTESDMTVINKYAAKAPIGESVEYLDVKGLNTASQVYGKLKEFCAEKKGKLSGLQIFGTGSDVPAFNLQFKVQMENDIDNMGTYLSDHFYSNFDNDANKLEGLSVYKAFAEKLSINFIPSWPVVRLPLEKGHYSAYFNKYEEYKQKLNSIKQIPLVNFSNPIFASNTHSDDMGYFIENRINKEFKILTSGQYSLYGNKEGMYPVNTATKGDFSAENMTLENRRGISDILINSHGQKNNIDKAIFIDGKEQRISTLNTQNINSVLGHNYYNLMTWTCNNAEGLDKENLAYKALAEGKAINVFAATSVLSNNGVDNTATLEEMRKNNFYYFYYSFMKHYYGGVNRSDSFWLAKRDYISGILDNSEKIVGNRNYQFNLNNALLYEHLGLLSFGEPVMGKGVVVSNAGAIKNNSTLVPMRAIFEALSYTVSWDNKTKTVTAVNNDLNSTIILTINKNMALVNGKSVSLAVSPEIIGGSTLVPLRFIGEASGSKVDWDNKSKVASVTTTVNNHKISYFVKTDGVLPSSIPTAPIENVKLQNRNPPAKLSIQKYDEHPTTEQATGFMKYQNSDMRNSISDWSYDEKKGILTLKSPFENFVILDGTDLNPEWGILDDLNNNTYLGNYIASSICPKSSEFPLLFYMQFGQGRISRLEPIRTDQGVMFEMLIPEAKEKTQELYVVWKSLDGKKSLTQQMTVRYIPE